MSENRRFLISEVEKIVSLLFLSPARNAKSERIFSALKRVKRYPRSILVKKSTTCANVDACSQKHSG